MTKILCDMTGCKYNNSCCLSSAENSYCTKEDIHISVNQEIYQLECLMFEEDMEKEVECQSCQIKKYGGIKLPKKIFFENKDSSEF